MNTLVTQWKGRKNGLANRVKAESRRLSRTGIGAIEMASVRRTAYDPNSVSLGYDPVRDYDWGQTTPTRIGTEKEIQACVRGCNGNGQVVTVDLPDRQYGDKPPYVEIGPDGKPDYTLFFKNEVLFEADPDDQWDPEPVPDDGVLAKFQHSKPDGYMLREKCKANKAMFDALGFGGHRRDEGKSMWPAALDALFAVHPGMDVAEVYSGDVELLDRYVRRFRVPVIDFPYHFACRDVSNGAGFGRLVGSAYADRNPAMAHRYVKSLDTRDVVANWPWFYLYGMTMPCRAFRIDGEDYETGGAWLIDNYAWLSSKLAFGPAVHTVIEDGLLCWYRDGNGGAIGRSAGVICGMSKDPINTQWRWTPTPFGPNKHLHDYAVSGGPDVWTNADGWACLPFGPNVFGSATNGFAYSLAGQDGPIHLPAIPYTGR